MKRNIIFWIFCAAGAALLLINTVYGIIFAVQLGAFYGGSVFNPSSHIAFSVFMIILNIGYILALLSYFIYRKIK